MTNDPASRDSNDELEGIPLSFVPLVFVINL